MDIAIITLVLTSFTALAAVIGPIISSVITVRSNERTKRFEIYSPQLYSAIQRLTAAYASFPRRVDYEALSPYQRTCLSEETPAKYREFSAAAYEVMALISSPDIHTLIIDLLADMKGEKFICDKHDQAFQKLSEALALELSSWVLPKKKRVAHNRKMRNSK